MTTKRKKLNKLTIEKKKEILDLMDKGVSRRKIAEQKKFKIVESTVGNIGKNRLNVIDNNCNSEKKRKQRTTDNEITNNKMLDFFKSRLQIFQSTDQCEG